MAQRHLLVPVGVDDVQLSGPEPLFISDPGTQSLGSPLQELVLAAPEGGLRRVDE